MLRLGLLIAGLVIIADLSTTAFTQRTFNADDAAAYAMVDVLVNVVLFSLLGVLVVRQTGLMLSGAVAGVVASLLDAIVVTMGVIQEKFIENLVVGTVFAGVSGVLYALSQRSGGRRSR